ncbi:MAG TPA: S8 family serine peptidase [Kofleriaceae bacterium]|nr:S8 family serine peptidase [Kofleriaceae bacterium]
MRATAMTAAISILLFACSTDEMGTDDPGDQASGDLADLQARASGQYIVTLRDQNATGTQWVEAHGVVAERVFDHSVRGCVLRGSADMAEALRSDPTVASVEQDMVITLEDSVADADSEVSADAAQITPPGITRVGGSSITNGRFAYVIDTGIDFDNDDLFVVKPLSRNFVKTEPNRGEDLNGHGTHVAGIIAAKDNDIDVVGVVASTPVVAVRVLSSSGGGLASDAIAGVDYVASVARAGDVANMSLSTPVRVAALDQAVLRAANRGILFALSAGNDAVDAATASPAGVNHPNVFTVSAIGTDNCLANFSNFGASVDFAAPGVGVRSLAIGGGTVSFNGTSQAAPHVAGLLIATRGRLRTDGFACRDRDARPDPIAHR